MWIFNDPVIGRNRRTNWWDTKTVGFVCGKPIWNFRHEINFKTDQFQHASEPTDVNFNVINHKSNVECFTWQIYFWMQSKRCSWIRTEESKSVFQIWSNLNFQTIWKFKIDVFCVAADMLLNVNWQTLTTNLNFQTIWKFKIDVFCVAADMLLNVNWQTLTSKPCKFLLDSETNSKTN